MRYVLSKQRMQCCYMISSLGSYLHSLSEKNEHACLFICLDAYMYLTYQEHNLTCARLALVRNLMPLTYINPMLQWLRHHILGQIVTIQARG